MLSYINLGLRVFFGSLAGVFKVAPSLIGYYVKGIGPPEYEPSAALGASLLKNDPGCPDPSNFADVTITTTDGIKLHSVIDAGTRRKTGLRPIVFVHGFPESWVSWHGQLEYFAAKGHPVLALDMRGYGLSDKPKGIENYLIEDCLVKDLRTVIAYATKELGDGKMKPLLVAHDWGASICYSYACQKETLEKEEIVGYVSLAIPPLKAFEENMSLKQFWASLYMIYFNMPYVPEKVFLFNNAWFIGAIMNDCKRGKIPAWLSHAYRANVLQKGAMEAQLNYYRSAIQRPPEPTEDVFGTKTNPLPLPTLIIRGLDDVALGDDIFKGLDQYLTDFKLVALENCSHWIQADCPKEVNTEIAEFLQKFDV